MFHIFLSVYTCQYLKPV